MKKYFTVTRLTTRDELDRQKKEMSVKLHPDKTLSGNDDEFKEMMNQYDSAYKDLLRYEMLRGTDDHGKLFLHGATEYIIDRISEQLGIPEWVKKMLIMYKHEIIEKMNFSEIMEKVEQKAKQLRSK